MTTVIGNLSKHDVDGAENWKSGNVTSRLCNNFSFIQVVLEKCVLTILELNWNQRLGDKKTKLNICHHMLTSCTQLQKFHVVERTRTSTKCEKNEICTCKACKNTIFHCQICKFVGFLLPSSSWLLKLPNDVWQRRNVVYCFNHFLKCLKCFLRKVFWQFLYLERGPWKCLIKQVRVLEFFE